MSDEFNSLPWHDANLLELIVDRNQPGQRDEIRLRIAWPKTGEAKLVFSDCYGLKAHFNFGIIADESISSALALHNDDHLLAIKNKWQSLGVKLDALLCFCIETSSTSSQIKIYANEFKIL